MEAWWHIRGWHLRIILYIFNTFLPSLLALIYIHTYFFIIHVHLLPLWRGFLFNPRIKTGYLRPSAHLVNYMKEWRFYYRSQGSDEEDFLVMTVVFLFWYPAPGSFYLVNPQNWESGGNILREHTIIVKLQSLLLAQKFFL